MKLGWKNNEREIGGFGGKVVNLTKAVIYMYEILKHDF